MSGGGAKSGGGSSSSAALEQISKDLFEESTPLRQELLNQYMEALTTGGIGARMPMVTQAVESSKQAESRTMRELGDRLSVMGFAGTPYGETIRAGTRMQGAQATARLPTDMTQQFITGLPGFLTGQGQTVVTGLGTSGQVANQAQANAMAPWLALMQGMGNIPFAFSG